MAHADLRKHVYIPVPSSKELPKETLSKPEMLAAILSNLDKSQQTVRHNILAAGKSKLQQAQNNNTPHPPLDPANSAAGMSLLLANLNAPAPLQDPCVPPTGYIPPPPPTIKQEPPPPEIQIAQETMQQLEHYDRTSARPARHYYQEALTRIESTDPRRRRSSGASNPSHAPTALGIAIPGFPRPAGYGSVSASPAERVRGGSGSSPWSGGGGGSANASPRDPRVRPPPR